LSDTRDGSAAADELLRMEHRLLWELDGDRARAGGARDGCCGLACGGTSVCVAGGVDP